MTPEQRRAVNAAKKRARLIVRRAQAKQREAARRANQERIDGIRLKGTALNEAAKKVRAAVGKKAIEAQRAAIIAEKKKAQKLSYDAAQKRIAEADKAERDAEKGERKMREDREPRVKQEADKKGRIYGSIEADDLGGALTAEQIVERNANYGAFFDNFATIMFYNNGGAGVPEAVDAIGAIINLYADWAIETRGASFRPFVKRLGDQG